MADNKAEYYITVWSWNGQEYEPQIVFESDDFTKTEKEYERLNPNIDNPLIELIEVGEDEDNRLKYKEA